VRQLEHVLRLLQPRIQSQPPKNATTASGDGPTVPTPLKSYDNSLETVLAKLSVTDSSSHSDGDEHSSHSPHPIGTNEPIASSTGDKEDESYVPAPEPKEMANGLALFSGYGKLYALLKCI
jgi:hypothetical protein